VGGWISVAEGEAAMNKCFIGDCRDTMRKLIVDGVKVQTCVTSPPYWGLRDYGVAGQLGLEATPLEYVDNMVETFGLVRELLADDGALWLNLGDSYAGAPGGYQGKHGQRESRTFTARIDLVKRGLGLKPKDLCGIPWRVAFALQADGWYLRQDIIWHKPNPMPESVRDRCTKAHEYIFLLSKRERYYFDADAIAEPLAYGSVERLSQPNLTNQQGSDRVPGKTNGSMKAVYRKAYTGESTKDYASGGAQDAGATKARIVDGILSGDLVSRNKRSVWTVTTKPFSGAHFATFPPDLIEPCILAGSRPGDVVLDPFMGSGTTAQVAQQLGRQWIGCELNPEYVQLQDTRTAQQGMVLA
jgi:DNA modification methylase